MWELNNLIVNFAVRIILFKCDFCRSDRLEKENKSRNRLSKTRLLFNIHMGRFYFIYSVKVAT